MGKKIVIVKPTGEISSTVISSFTELKNVANINYADIFRAEQVWFSNYVRTVLYKAGINVADSKCEIVVDDEVVPNAYLNMLTGIKIDERRVQPFIGNVVITINTDELPYE